MTNQEAITIIGNLEDKDILFNPCDVQDAKTMAIKALEQEPKLRQALEQEKGAYNALVKNIQCADAISRQAVLDIDFHRIMHTTAKPSEMIRQEIINLPPVNPQEPKTGHWILDETDNSITCDKCGCLIWANDISNGEAYYCPNCGSAMKEE